MSAITVMLPDMPTTEELVPWLKKIDENRWYSNFGPLNQLLCQKIIATFNNTQTLFAVTVCNATLGLELVLRAFNLPSSSHILIPGLTFVATATAVLRSGFTPLVGDIDPHNWLLTPKIAEEILAKYPYSAVMPVAAFGHPHNVDEWDDFTQRTGIPVIIDAAGAYGNQMVGKKTIVVFSMHATKCLGGGEGGLIISTDEALLEKIRVNSNFGLGSAPGSRIIYEPGTNAKLSEYHAAVCLASLERFPERTKIRQHLYQHYQKSLKNTEQFIQFQLNSETTIKSLFVIRLNRCSHIDDIMQKLAQNGIQTLRWYYPPIHQHPGFSSCKIAAPLHHVEEIAPQLIGLPFHPFLSEDDIEHVCNSLLKAYMW